MKKLSQKGFTMIELLVVLLIIGILAAVAAPLFLSNSDRAKASEAVAALGAIRSAERTYKAQTGSYTVDGALYVTGASSEVGSLIGVIIESPKYFANTAYAVDVGGSFSATVPAGSAAAQDFVIGANGTTAAGAGQYAGFNRNLSVAVHGGRNSEQVSNIKVEMDNSGKIIYTTDGTNWKEY
jgi:prepilin-type N-terminal cleavage/methylation domain-containing protein